MSEVTAEEIGTACNLCGTLREFTERTSGVWTTCDYCGAMWWCHVAERDYLDEPTEWACSGGCDDGWDCACVDEEYDDEG